MQLSSDVSDNFRIVTAYNANKKLSFQGWDKCVEAFSQGKGTLSHHCTRMMSQMDSSQPDEVISWSSSEGECDESSSNQRSRPSRTLASRINFDDCKQVHQRGRRLTSAQFVRLIERRPENRSPNCSDELLGCTLNIRNDGPNYTENILDSSKLEEQSCSESFEELVWMKNLSFLNQRICSESLNLTDLSSAASEPGIQPDQEGGRSSPILVPHKTRVNKKKTSRRIPSGSASNPKSVENDFQCVTPNIPHSPIFKTSSYKKRRRSRVSEACSLKSEKSSLADHQTATSFSVCDKKEQSDFTTNSSTVEKNTPCYSPKVARSVTCEAGSPIFGKQRKDTKKLVNELRSPILGSVSIPRTRRSAASHLKIQTAAQDITDASSWEERPVADHSTSLPNQKFQDANSEVDDELSLLTAQSKTNAKRSLDFSHQKRVRASKTDGIARTDPQLTNNSCGQSILNSMNASREVEDPVKKVVKGDLQGIHELLSSSHLIEEINTEQYDEETVPVKKTTTPTLLRKKKKLSLPKNTTSAKIDHKNGVQIRKDPSSKVNKTPDSLPVIAKMLTHQDCKTNNTKQAEKLPQNQICFTSKKEISSLKNFPEPPRLPNNTQYIEEAFSEPMEESLHDFVSSPEPVSNRNSLRKELTSVETAHQRTLKCGKDDVVRQWNSKENEVLIIDGFTSPSIASNHSGQIERLTSPSLASPSPITISQSSSPPAPANVDLMVAQEPDNFNAPPKKGRKKLKPDGLASRLQRLLNRQRSSSRIWQFKRSKLNKISSTDNQDCGASVLLRVERTWTEYSHVIVQSYVCSEHSKEKLSGCVKELSNCVIVILNPNVAERLGQIMVASKLRLFPPWQAMKLRGASVILCATCIEVVSLKEFPIQESPEECPVLVRKGLENVQGINLPLILFPNVKENCPRLMQFSEINSIETSKSCESPITIGTVSNIVSSHCVGGATQDWLIVTIIRAFQYRQPGKDETFGNNPVWSLLGQDVAGELCEVVLGSEEPSLINNNILLAVKTGDIFGKVYHFSGFFPIQRISPFRVSSLWSVVSSIASLETCDQSVFYVLAPASSSWESKPSRKEMRQENFHPKFSSFKGISSEIDFHEPRRFNVLCRVLHSTSERLYVTDMEMSPIITTVSINPVAYVPCFSSKDGVSSILGLEVLSGELRADKYTRIDCIGENNIYNYPGIQDLCKNLACLKLELPLLHENTAAKSLAVFSGLIVGVDEESAFMWPACGNCGNELLSAGMDGGKYHCEKCPGLSDNFTLRMSLQVLASCHTLPKHSTVRIKLLQDTIEVLLPPSLCSEEGYDMNTVIGRRLGPLKCEVLFVTGRKFTLQELP